MTFWKVFLIVLLALWLISLIRIGGRVSYGEAGLFAAALAGPFKIQLRPAKPKREKKSQQKKPNKEKPPAAEPREKNPKEGQPGTLSRLMKLLPVVGQACGALKRKICFLLRTTMQAYIAAAPTASAMPFTGSEPGAPPPSTPETSTIPTSAAKTQRTLRALRRSLNKNGEAATSRIGAK